MHATLAFLDGDRETLQACRDEIAAGPKWGDRVPNLEVVERLLERIGKPYRLAYRP